MTTAFALVLAILVLVNVWVHLGLRLSHHVTGPVAALVLLLVARAAGLSWAELGLARENLLTGLLYGLAAAALVALVYAVGVLVPVTRRAFHDTRYRMPMRSAVLMSLVTIPLATVVFEEVAFRSVFWGMLEHQRGVGVATVVSSALFGFWHVLPALDVANTSTVIRGSGRPNRRRLLLTVLATVVFTAVAGVVFAELRRRSGSIVAPLGLHWATNGLAVVAAARVWRVSPPSSGPADPSV
jgi:membrane protease YdiL (CAAX protease family)